MAMYNGGFPASYQQYYPQYMMAQPQTQPQQQAQNSSIIWVQGEAGAKSYLVAPNNTVQLWDSERQTIYLKSADASGMPSMRILDYTIRQESSQNPSRAVSAPAPIEICRADLDALQSQIDALKEEIESYRNIPRHSRKEKGANESTIQSDAE